MSGIEIDRDFWSDRLEVNVDDVIDYFEDDEYMKRWSPLGSSRCRAILAEQLALDSDMAKRYMVEAVLDLGREVLPFMLVNELGKGKAEIAIRQVAKESLSEAQNQRCEFGEDNFDRIAAMWFLYLANPAYLERVFFLDIIHQKGFARMVLAEAPDNVGADVATFFTRDNLNPLVEAYDRSRRDHRTGHCSEILFEADRIQVIVRRDFAPAKVRKAGQLFHGFNTEWIILEFHPGLERVDVCSVSPDVPAQLANRIAQAYFYDEKMRYENDAQFVSEEILRKFLESFKMEKPPLPLLELQFKNSGLNGSPEVRLKVEKDSSLAPALDDYSEVFGDPFEQLIDIVGIKILVANKIIRIKIEKDERRKMWTVRYTDSRLLRKERTEFEALMDDEFDIPILSTEKRYARQ